MQIGGNSGITDPTITQGVETLGDILLELQSKIDDGGTVRLNADDISALQQVTATILGVPTDYPDAAAQTQLASIYAALQSALDVAVNNFPADYPDATTHTYLSQSADLLTDILGETGDNGTLLDSINNGIASLVAAGTGGGLTNAELRAAPVPVSGTVAVSNFPATQPVSGTVAVSNPGLTDSQLRANPVPVSDGHTDYPSSSANTKLDTLHTDNGTASTSPPTSGTGIIGWLRGIYDKVAALPTTVGLTDTQLRATAVPVSGTVTVLNPTAAGLTDTQLRASAVPVTDTRTDYPSTGANTRLDQLHTDLAAGVVADTGKGSPALFTGNIAAANTLVATTDISAYRSLRIALTSATAAGTNAIFEGSFDGTNWFSVSGMVHQHPGYSNANGPAYTNPLYSASNVSVYDVDVWFPFFRVRAASAITNGVDVRILALNVAAGLPYVLDNDSRSSSPGFDTMARAYAYTGTVWQRIRSGARAHNSAQAFTGALQVVTNQGVYSQSQTIITTGAAQNLGQTVVQHALQVRFSAGAVTTATVVLQGSLDSAGWTTLVAWDTASGQASGDIVFAANKPVNYVRINVTAMTGTGTVLATYNGGI